MIDAYLDDLLDELVQTEPRAHWGDVLDRARRSRRRYVAVAATVAALVLAPAAWAIASAFEGKPAPASVKANFRYWNHISPQMARALKAHGGTYKPIVSKAHGVIQVQTADGPLDLWAAPTKEGGTCYFVGWQSNLRKTASGESTCVPASAKAFNAGSSAHNLEVSWGGDYQHRNYSVVEGYAYGGATTVRVTRTDGSTKTLPVVEGLFLGALHQSVHWRLRPKLVSVVARDAQGRVVGYLRLQRR
jgi:hypothetical protein